VDVAVERFARQGYAATSVREIASRVGVNPAMVHYYFGSKLSLLQIALEQSLEPLAGAIAKMRAAGDAPAGKIVKLLLDTLSARPFLAPLVVREVMLPGGVMQEHFLEYLAPRLGGAMPFLLEKEQKNGRMNKNLDTRISTLMLLSLCIFPFIVREAAEPALQISYDKDGLCRLEQHIDQLLKEGFSP
jgi:AcrR family transcriptional regulator